MTALAMMAQNNVAEEVAWVIGNEPIFKSDIEDQYQQAIIERVPIEGNPYCVIPEKMAVEKLFLDQARIDTVEVQPSTIANEVDAQINYLIANLGSKEKVEEYFRQPMPRLREKLSEMFSDRYCIQQVQNDLTKNVKATPAEVRRFYNGLLPEYANAAYNLNDPKRVSNIVETDDGFHIIQLIEKRGDRINTRHILLRPKVSDKDLTDAMTMLDSVRSDIVSGKNTFDMMALYISQDKDSRNNNGHMLNEKNQSGRFEMADLPAEVGRKIYTMQPGEVSEPFIMINPKTRREQVAIVKLVKRIDGHKADLAEDYMIIKDMCEATAKEEIIRNWVTQKQKSVYVYIEEGWRNCDFKYDWLKTDKQQ